MVKKKSAKKPARKKAGFVGRYFDSYNFTGVVVGALFASLSFTPSILPRGWVMQAVLIAVCFSIGYAFGAFISWSVRQFPVHEPSNVKAHKIKQLTYTVLLIIFGISFIYGFNSQQQVSKLVGMSGPPSASVLGTVIVAGILIFIIIGISRLIRRLYWWLLKQLDKILPRSFSYVIAIIATFFIAAGLFNGLILSNVRDGINSAYSLRNDSTDEGIVQPQNPELSGSPNSLIAWDTLGKQGRKFIGTAVPKTEIQDFTKKPAKNPVRVYSGLESAGSATDRAKLAANDLERAGGFKRKVLVVVTTTGTGWVNETSANSIEYMYGGDSAIVSMQYSYLPSWISFLVDKDKAKESGMELYNAVFEKWVALPVDQRPKLVSYGESLGSFGGEAAFPAVSSFKATSQGALFVGPPSSNSMWQRAVAARDEGTPEILPVVNKGQTLRFAAETKDLDSPPSVWNFPRATYLQHGSDPIVWWSPHLMFSKPDWLKEPRAKDVSSRTMWFPVVTFFQLSADMAHSTSVPDGYGHNYGTLPIDAWAKIAAPSGWTPANTDALKAKFTATNP